MADHLSTILVQHGPDLAWVEPGEQSHGSEHETSIEDVQEPLVRDEISIVTLSVLGQTEDRSNQNERAAAI